LARLLPPRGFAELPIDFFLLKPIGQFFALFAGPLLPQRFDEEEDDRQHDDGDLESIDFSQNGRGEHKRIVCGWAYLAALPSPAILVRISVSAVTFLYLAKSMTPSWPLRKASEMASGT